VRYRFGSTGDRPPLSEFHRQLAEAVRERLGLLCEVKYDSKKNAANVSMALKTDVSYLRSSSHVRIAII
jgi:hypothetical protein